MVQVLRYDNDVAQRGAKCDVNISEAEVEEKRYVPWLCHSFLALRRRIEKQSKTLKFYTDLKKGKSQAQLYTS